MVERLDVSLSRSGQGDSGSLSAEGGPSEIRSKYMADDTNAVEAVSGSNVGAQMSYEDMRGWLKEAERLGELRVAEGL